MVTGRRVRTHSTTDFQFDFQCSFLMVSSVSKDNILTHYSAPEVWSARARVDLGIPSYMSRLVDTYIVPRDQEIKPFLIYQSNQVKFLRRVRGGRGDRVLHLELHDRMAQTSVIGRIHCGDRF
jgi:hypothetical protein